MTVKPTVDLLGAANVSVAIPVKVVVGLNTKYYGQVIYLENDNFKQLDEQENSDETDKLKDENDQLDLTEDDVTDEDRKKHKKIGDSIERSLKQDSSAATFDEFYAEKVAQAKALENQYQPQLSKGINLDLDLESKAKAEKDGELKVELEIKPNNLKMIIAITARGYMDTEIEEDSSDVVNLFRETVKKYKEAYLAEEDPKIANDEELKGKESYELHHASLENLFKKIKLDFLPSKKALDPEGNFSLRINHINNDTKQVILSDDSVSKEVDKILLEYVHRKTDSENENDESAIDIFKMIVEDQVTAYWSDPNVLALQSQSNNQNFEALQDKCLVDLYDRIEAEFESELNSFLPEETYTLELKGNNPSKKLVYLLDEAGRKCATSTIKYADDEIVDVIHELKEHIEMLLKKAIFVNATAYSGGKHVDGNSEDGRKKKSSNGGAGQYLYSLTNQQIAAYEREAIQEGRVQENRDTVGNPLPGMDQYYFSHEFSEIIGYSGGKTTKKISAEMTTANTTPEVHSHPR